MLLRRILGTGSAIAIPVGIAIGSGIFRTPNEVADTVGASGLIFIVYIAAGIRLSASPYSGAACGGSFSMSRIKSA